MHEYYSLCATLSRPEQHSLCPFQFHHSNRRAAVPLMCNPPFVRRALEPVTKRRDQRLDNFW